MTRLVHRVFDPNRPVLVRRPFVAAGRHFETGDTFDWKRLSVDQRRTRLLYENGKLMHAEDATAGRPAPMPNVLPPMPETALQPVVTAPVTDNEPQDDLTDLDLKELRAIALDMGVPYRVSRTEQRQAIREARRGGQD